MNAPVQLDMFHEIEHHHKYQDGYVSGSNWDANWIPGGPWIAAMRSEKYRELHERTKLENQYWMQGWHDGLKVRLNASPEFAAWWQVNGKHTGVYENRRYWDKNG